MDGVKSQAFLCDHPRNPLLRHHFLTGSKEEGVAPQGPELQVGMRCHMGLQEHQALLTTETSLWPQFSLIFKL